MKEITYAWNFQRMQDAVSRLKDASVLILGDIMLDEYLFGDADRISPEAPIPVVHVQETKTLVGGAGNVARNVRSLGGAVRLIGLCGRDEKGLLLESLIREGGIDACLHRSEARPTTVKTRILARQQQMLRVDRETCQPIRGKELDRLLELLAEALPGQNVLIVSDYNKGLVSHELMEKLRQLCARQARPPRILVDPKVPNFAYYSGVDLLTPNALETSQGAGLPVGTPEEILKAGRALFQRLHCRHLLTTLGAQGMAVFRSAEEIWHIPTFAREVYDVTGAGDTVIAVTALALAAGLDLLDACLLANYAAGIVVGEVGAATVEPDALRESMRSLPNPQVVRWA